MIYNFSLNYFYMLIPGVDFDIADYILMVVIVEIVHFHFDIEDQ